MAGQSGGPWGGGSNGGGGGDNGRGGNGPSGRPPSGNRGNGGRRPEGEGQAIPEIDELMRKGQEQLRVLMGGRGDGGNGGAGRPGGSGGPALTRGTAVIGLLGLLVLYLFASFYTVKPEQQGVELLLGKEFRVTDDGPHFAWWPFITVEVINTTTERT